MPQCSNNDPHARLAELGHLSSHVGCAHIAPTDIAHIAEQLRAPVAAPQQDLLVPHGGPGDRVEQVEALIVVHNELMLRESSQLQLTAVMLRDPPAGCREGQHHAGWGHRLLAGERAHQEELVPAQPREEPRGAARRTPCGSPRPWLHEKWACPGPKPNCLQLVAHLLCCSRPSRGDGTQCDADDESYNQSSSSVSVNQC